ncbi:hypothetical protein HFD88_002118 [Aspergillus terreus]|nr:hypothetical protein HFD88_002118 [Aspergillus terreus]
MTQTTNTRREIQARKKPVELNTLAEESEGDKKRVRERVPSVCSAALADRSILSYLHLRVFQLALLAAITTTTASNHFTTSSRDFESVSTHWNFLSPLPVMAYQFFAKAHQNKSPTSPPLSPPHPSSSPVSGTRHARPPRPPQPLVVPPPSQSSSVNISTKLKPPSSRDPSFQPPAYPHPVEAGYQTPHPHVTIESVSTAHIPSLTRITGLLLPIRYPNSFYTATITDPVIASLSRVAIYHDHPVAAGPAAGTTPSASTAGTDKVIGGIRCRLERLPPSSAEILPQSETAHPSQPEPTNLYIQTLHLLSPYRGCGIAASLLNALLFASNPSAAGARAPPYPLSDLVKHYNIRTVTAHVHEANEEGLKWYIARGFEVEEGVVENYYRRLKPSGARIVKMVLPWGGESAVKTTEKNQRSPQGREDEDDDDWEKVEAEDGDDPEEHGVQPVADSPLPEVEDGSSRKRKADEEPQRS